ncbi:MAG: DUF2807 domain-containing protein [Chitinophagales bacterium]|nr:DUF2807 domain-containing protein [Chitinophagaceae bacterium]MCB9064442.1 DUF2807 domain-containing protein [Chitinophagales bacterium]
MKKTLLLSTVIALLSLSFISCKRNIVHGKGVATTEQRKVSKFNKVRISIPADVTITTGEGESYSLDINAKSNLHEYLHAEIVDGELRIYTNDIVLGKTDINISIHTPSIDALELNGATESKIAGVLKNDKFNLEVNGASEVEIEELEVESFYADMSGASQLDVHKGSAKNAVFDIAGAGEVKALNLICGDVKAEVSGAGEISVHATEKLDADISGAGTIEYKGTPKITSDISGVGQLVNRN